MFKKSLLKGAAYILVMSMIAGMLTGCGTTTNSTSGNSNVACAETLAAETEEDLGDLAESLHSDTAGKTETVYVIKKNDGSEEKIVSEWLKNAEGSETLSDASNLNDIVVTKGNSTYKKSEDGTLSWTTDGSDVYYQGTTDAELPVDVEITYTLDGKEVSVEDLEGATGHLVVTYKYINNTGSSEKSEYGDYTIYQPFIMITGAIFDNKSATNITVSGGQAVNDGDRTIVMGMGFPGMNESLGLSELDLSGITEDSEDTTDEGTEGTEETEEAVFELPEETVIECDVTNYSPTMSLTVAADTALDKLDLSDLDDSGVSDKLTELTDAMQQILDGTSALKDGASQLNDGATDLSDGVDTLKEGTDTLATGTETFSEKMDELSEGAGKVDEGAKELKAGLETLQGKVPALADGVTALLDGATKLAEGLDTLTANNDALNGGVASLVSGLKQLQAGITAATGGESASQMQQLVQGSAQFKSGLGDLTDGLDAIVAGGYFTGAKDANGNSVTTPEGTDATTVASLDRTIADLTTYYTTIETGITNYDTNLLSALIKHGSGMDSALTQAEQVSLYTFNQKVQAGDAEALNVYQNYAANLTMAEEVKGIVTAYATLYGGVATADAGADQLNQSYAQIDSGIKTLVTSVSTSMQTLSSGVTQLIAGAVTLQEGLGAYTEGAATAGEGAGQLKDGLATLSGSVPTLTDGVDALVTGAGSLSDGTSQVADGAKQLADASDDIYDGAFKLSEGAKQLDEGTDKLTDGISALFTGTVDLNDGIVKFNDEGVQKVVDLVTENYDKYSERVENLQAYAGEFQSFGGCTEDVECSTVFVFRTE